jgi:hypothetical protein
MPISVVHSRSGRSLNRFSDFQVVHGITLPAQYEVRLRIEPSKGLEYQCLTTLNDVKDNPF